MLTRRYDYQSDFARGYLCEGLIRALLAVLGARGVEVDTATRERIKGCTTPGLLERWITRAALASSLGEVFIEPCWEEPKTLTEGEARGWIRGEATALLAVLESRGWKVDEATRERILGCPAPGLLTRWIARAVIASSLHEVFADV
jgi:hypothetical protein